MEFVFEDNCYIIDEFPYDYIDHRGNSFSLTFVDLGLDHPFFSTFIQKLLDRVRPDKDSPVIHGRIALPNADSGLDAELEKELCISNFIVCLIQLPDGSNYFGTNGIRNKQHFCTTDLYGLDNYDPCKSETVCNQEGHGEMIAIANWLSSNGYMTTEQYLSVQRKRPDGKPSGIIDHILMIDYIVDNGLESIFLDQDVKVYLQGHSKCCKECAEALYRLGVRTVYSSIESHKNERANRKKTHMEYFNRNPDVKIELDSYLPNVALEA
jgi:hypothetical protein